MSSTAFLISLVVVWAGFIYWGFRKYTKPSLKQRELSDFLVQLDQIDVLDEVRQDIETRMKSKGMRVKVREDKL